LQLSALLLRKGDLSSWVPALGWERVLLICQKAGSHLTNTLLVILSLILVIKIFEKSTRRHLKIVHLLELLLNKIRVRSVMAAVTL